MESTKENFSAKDVMALRQKTGLGMMDCKKALAENNGDMQAAEEWLRAKRKGKMDTRTDRATGEGRIGVAVEGGKASIVEIRTETDFTARNEEFVKMVDDVAKEALSLPPGECMQPTDSMAKRIDDLRITTGENVNFARAMSFEGGSFGYYIHHDGKSGVLLQIEGDGADPETLKGVCQHIVFHAPLGISEADLDEAQLNTIRTEALKEAQESGKPDEIAQKIAEGKVRKYLEENTLLHQKYVLDEQKQVKDVLPAGVTVKAFARFTVGAD